MSRGDIGDCPGLTIETVSRMFTQLKKKGVIGILNVHEAQILNRDALNEIAGFEGEEQPAAAAF